MIRQQKRRTFTSLEKTHTMKRMTHIRTLAQRAVMRTRMKKCECSNIIRDSMSQFDIILYEKEYDFPLNMISYR